MAFKVTVDYQDLRLVINTDSVESVNVFQHLKTTVDYQDLRQLLAYQQLTAANVLVDADTLNRYFTAQYNSPNAESFGLTDSDTFSFGKGLGDTPIVTEQLANAMQKPLTESVSIGENLSRVIDFFRVFADTSTISETHVYLLGKAASDSISITEEQTFVTTKLLEDTYGFSDSQVLEVEQAREDSFSFTDDFSRVVPYVRSFADTYGLDDTSSVDDELATNTGVNKTNIVNVSETTAFAFTPGTIEEGVSVAEVYVSSFVPGDIAEGVSVAEAYVSSFTLGTVAETATISESPVFSILPVFADTATISESIDVELIKGVGPLNNSALNLNMLNA
tara:strand:- start:1353 stop:2357 length:1005 start_codon:yes stop_codon:yes gene_type:complete